MIKINNYTFFYDESFHDRELTLNKRNGYLKQYNADYSDIFVGVFLGLKDEEVRYFDIAYKEFDEKYKKFFQVSEFKGEIISKKNFINGFRSFNRNTVGMYKEYFSLLDKHNCLMQANMYSKLEFLFREAIINLPGKNFTFMNKNQICYVSKDAFIYALIKFIHCYKDFKIEGNLLSENPKNFIKSLYNSLKHIKTNSYGVKRKEKERKAINESLIVLNNIYLKLDNKKQYRWKYNFIFEGLNLLLDEKSINELNTTLLLDEENRTLECSKSYDYKRIESLNSKSSLGIRSADLLSNFLGRMVYAINKVLDKEQIDNISEERVLIPDEWFKLSKNQFDLVKVIASYFQKQAFYSVYTGIYFDYVVIIFSYINYISTYCDFEEYNKKDVYHGVLGNTYILCHLNERIKKISI